MTTLSTRRRAPYLLALAAPFQKDAILRKADLFYLEDVLSCMTIGNFTPAAFVGSIGGLPLKSGIAFSLFPTVFIFFLQESTARLCARTTAFHHWLTPSGWNIVKRASCRHEEMQCQAVHTHMQDRCHYHTCCPPQDRICQQLVTFCSDRSHGSPVEHICQVSTMYVEQRP